MRSWIEILLFGVFGALLARKGAEGLQKVGSSEYDVVPVHQGGAEIQHPETHSVLENVIN